METQVTELAWAAETGHITFSCTCLGQNAWDFCFQSCICIPKEDELELYPTTQWIDAAQSSIAQVLNMPENK